MTAELWWLTLHEAGQLLRDRSIAELLAMSATRLPRSLAGTSARKVSTPSLTVARESGAGAAVVAEEDCAGARAGAGEHAARSSRAAIEALILRLVDRVVTSGPQLGDRIARERRLVDA